MFSVHSLMLGLYFLMFFYDACTSIRSSVGSTRVLGSNDAVVDSSCRFVIL